MTPEIKKTIQLLNSVLSAYEEILEKKQDEYALLQVIAVKTCIKTVEEYWNDLDIKSLLQEPS